MVEKKLLERGGKDMINNVEINLEIINDYLDIKVNGVSKKKLTVKNKTINTKDVFKMFDYERTKIYKLGCKKIDEKELKGEKNEIKRLYNYTYELLDEIINSINDVTKELTKGEK